MIAFKVFVFWFFMMMAVSIIELFELFKSQTIIQEYNNDIMENIYNGLKKTYDSEENEA